MSDDDDPKETYLRELFINVMVVLLQLHSTYELVIGTLLSKTDKWLCHASSSTDKSILRLFLWLVLKVMQIIDTVLDSVKVIEPEVYGDDRGFFMETWNRQTFEQGGLPGGFLQDNHSRSSRGVLRGMHYQVKHPQGKLVRVTRGEVFDVAVDLRQSSPQFGQWAGVLLSETNNRQMWVPEGFAHGFYVVSESADFQYKCTDYYHPEFERSLKWDDPEVGIVWPIADGIEPLLAAKDLAGKPFRQCEVFE